MEITDDKIFETIKSFVSGKLGIEINNLTRQTTIETDCGASGLDSITFFEDFFEHFNIQLPKGFNYDRCVTPDGIDLQDIIKSLFSKKYREAHKTIDITLGNLEQAVITGYWKNI